MKKSSHHIPICTLAGERLTANQVCALLEIHRSTLQRKHSSGELPADGASGGGRKYWLRATVDAYRIGDRSSPITSYVECDLLKEVHLPLPKGGKVLGQLGLRLPLDESSRVRALSSLLTLLADAPPSLLALPTSTASNHIHQTVVEACRLLGVPVLLHPGY